MDSKLYNKDCLFSFLILLSATTLANANTQYIITDLGKAQNFTDGFGIGINNAGNTTGSSGDPYYELSRAFYNIAGGAPTDIPFLSGYFYNWAIAINDNNQVAVNDRVTIDLGSDISIYDIDTNTSINLGGGISYDINNNGTILGRDGNGIKLYTTAGNTTVSGFGAYTFAVGTAINNNGAFTGYVEGAVSPASQAFLYNSDAVIELGTLPDSGDSRGSDLNDLNQVVGTVSFTVGTTHSNKAFLWENGVMTDLGMLDGDDSSGASGINNLGQIVGTSRNSSAGQSRPFIYENGTMTALEDLIINGSGWDIVDAVAINDAGQITGTGYNTIQQVAYLLTPLLQGDIAPHSAPDGVVNIGDLLLLTRMVLGSIEYTSEDLLRVDLNGNATLDTGDIVLMVKLLFTP